MEADSAGAQSVAFGHIGDSNVHFKVQVPAQEGVSEKTALTRMVYDKVRDAKGWFQPSMVSA